MEVVSEGNKSDGEKPASLPPSAGFGELFRFADRLDYILMGIGTVGAFVHGCSLPLFLRFFADLVNSFGSNANNIDKMTQEVLKYAFYFLVVGAAIWASSWAEISCWMWTGERQTTRMRIEYLEAALNQDIQYFDTEIRTSDVVFGINTDVVMVQDAMSEKLGNFIHYMATFASGFVVGFTAVWQLALVTLAVVPLIAVIGAIHTTTLSKLSSKSQESLSQAGNIAEQTIVQIRTVFAFVGESRALQAYSSALKTSQRLGYKIGFSKGLGLGATYFTVRALFTLAAKVSPTIIFVDEVDSMLGQRLRAREHEAMQKKKNEFMTHWDGLLTKQGEKILVLAATNRPFDLDEAIIRRFMRRIMVGLPSVENREMIMKTLLVKEKVDEGLDFKELASMTEGYSGSDLKNLCTIAAYRPVRELIQQERLKDLEKCKLIPNSSESYAYLL